MGTLPAANGLRLFRDLPHTQMGGGFHTELGTYLPPGGKVVATVNSAGIIDGDHANVQGRQVKTLAQALPLCRSGKNDIILVAPGHAENVTDATMFADLVPGTQIIGLGYGSNMPTFTWTATAGQWTLDQADVRISGLKLDMTGVNGVVDAIEVSAAYCSITGCELDVADSDTAHAVIVCSVGADGDFFNFSHNHVHGDATAGVTNGVLIDGAADNVVISGNVMIASAAVANGLINVTAAATNILIVDNIIANTETASTACIAFGNVAGTGVVARNLLSTLNDGTASAQGVTFGAASLVRAFENYSSDEPKLSGILAPAAAT